MERPFVKFRQYFINLEAVSCVEITEDGGMAVTVFNRDQPIRLSAAESVDLQKVLGRFSLQIRSSEEDS